MKNEFETYAINLGFMLLGIAMGLVIASML